MREPEHARHEGAHILRCLGVRILETRNGREDLRERDEYVCGDLGPDREIRGLRWVEVDAGVCVFAARRLDVNEVLDHGGDDHGEHGADEAGLDLLQRREVDAHACEEWVEEFVEDGDEYDEGEWAVGGVLLAK